MFYGVEQSTDLRSPHTVIKKFTSKKSLLKWLQNTGHFTHSDPGSARNYHHTFRYGYEHYGRVDKNHQAFKATGTPTYPKNENDKLASYLYTVADKVEIE